MKAQLPPKTYSLFNKMDQQMIEKRKADLEIYLMTILKDQNSIWKSSSIWTQFLQVPSESSGKVFSSSVSDLYTIILFIKRDQKKYLLLNGWTSSEI